MTTYFLDIRAALDARLNTLSGLPPVAWPNTRYEPVYNTLWLRPTLLPSGTRAATMTEDMHTGIYQIDIFAPIGTGPAATDAMADAIADHFKPLTSLTSGSATVRCITVSRRVATTDDAWYHTIIEVSYLSLTPNR